MGTSIGANRRKGGDLSQKESRDNVFHLDLLLLLCQHDRFFGKDLIVVRLCLRESLSDYSQRCNKLGSLQRVRGGYPPHSGISFIAGFSNLVNSLWA